MRKHSMGVAAALVVVVAAVIVLVVVLRKDKGGENKSLAPGSFCCSFDAETCAGNEYCDSDATACQEECGGIVQPVAPGPLFTEPGQSCLPATTDTRAVTTDLDTSKSPLLLERSDFLCTLWQVSDTRIVPVARSYGGHRWEPYASDLFSEITSFTCDENVCRLDALPPLLPGHKYELASFDHELSTRDEIAVRFPW